MVTLAELEQETAARVGPFAVCAVVSGDAQSFVVEELRSTIDLGGWLDLHILRRTATQPADRLARVKDYGPALGSLQADRQYIVTPQAGEHIELHHLPPDVLRRGVRAGLRRTYCQYWLTLNPQNPLDPLAPWVPDSGPVDLTDYSGGWLQLPQQVLDVVNPEADGSSVEGWDVYQHNGGVVLILPAGTANVGLDVIAYRDHFGLVNGITAPDGPTKDTDVIELPLNYGAAFGHAELWRIARSMLETVAAEGRQATQAEAAAEATRLALSSSPWLFASHHTRHDRIAPLRGLTGALGPSSHPSLQGAWVNGPNGMEPTNGARTLNGVRGMPGGSAG